MLGCKEVPKLKDIRKSAERWPRKTIHSNIFKKAYESHGKNSKNKEKEKRQPEDETPKCDAARKKFRNHSTSKT